MRRIARYRDDKNLEALTARLFSVAGPEAKREAKARLVEANRHLALDKRGSMTKRLERGTVIVVPDVEGARGKASTSPLGRAGARAVLERAKEAIEARRAGIEPAGRRVAADVQRTLELADSRPLRAAAERDERLSGALERVRHNAAARLERLEAAETTQRAALDAAHATVTELLERGRGRS